MDLVVVSFVVHCTRVYANRRKISMIDAVNIFPSTNLIEEYIIPNFDMLHTQGDSYLYEVICECLGEEV